MMIRAVISKEPAAKAKLSIMNNLAKSIRRLLGQNTYFVLIKLTAYLGRMTPVRKLLGFLVDLATLIHRNGRTLALDASKTVFLEYDSPKTWRFNELLKELSRLGVSYQVISTDSLVGTKLEKSDQTYNYSLSIKRLRWWSIRDWIVVRNMGFLLFSNPYLSRGIFCGPGGLGKTEAIYVPYNFGLTKDGSEFYFGSKTIEAASSVSLFTKKLSGRYSERLRIRELAWGAPDSRKITEEPKSITDQDELRILWAPHWTTEVDPDAGKSLWRDWFLEMVSLRHHLEKSGVQCSIRLRPHPRLIEKILNPQTQTGKELIKSLSYEEIHLSSEDSSIYEDFNWSSLIIHNSASFIAEYSLSLKPALFIGSESEVLRNLNDFGLFLLSGHYLLDEPREAQALIELMLFEGFDLKREKRRAIANQLGDCRDFETQAAGYFLERL